MLTKFIFITLLSIFWLVLCGIDGVKNYPILSVCSLVLTIALSSKLKLTQKRYFNFIKLISYSLWLIKEIINSSIKVSKIIWSFKLKINPKIIELETGLKPKSAEIVLLANSITLTPGTYTIDERGDKLLVHALTDSHITDLNSESMLNKVKKYFT